MGVFWGDSSCPCCNIGRERNGGYASRVRPITRLAWLVGRCACTGIRAFEHSEFAITDTEPVLGQAGAMQQRQGLGCEIALVDPQLPYDGSQFSVVRFESDDGRDRSRRRVRPRFDFERRIPGSRLAFMGAEWRSLDLQHRSRS